MRVRNNTNGEYPLTFSTGKCLMLGRAEVSREITEKESNDPYFKKELKNRRIMEYKDPALRKPVAKKVEPKKEEKVVTNCDEPEFVETEKKKEDKPETTRVIKRGKKKSPKSADKD